MTIIERLLRSGDLHDLQRLALEARRVRRRAIPDAGEAVREAQAVARQDPTNPKNYRCADCAGLLRLVYDHPVIPWTEIEPEVLVWNADKLTGEIGQATDWHVFAVCDRCMLYWRVGNVPAPPEGATILGNDLGRLWALPDYRSLDDTWDGFVRPWEGDAYWLLHDPPTNYGPDRWDE